MADPLSIKAALDSLKVASDMVKVLRSTDTAFEKAELKLRVAALAEALANARLAVLDAQEEIQDLRAQLATASEQRNSRKNLVKRDNVYYFKEAAGETGPFCPRCYEVDGRSIPVTQLERVFHDVAKFMCPNCQASY